MANNSKPKTYRGIVRIECTAESCDAGIANDVIPECMNCEMARVDILDLEDRPVWSGTFVSGSLEVLERPDGSEPGVCEGEFLDESGTAENKERK